MAALTGEALKQAQQKAGQLAIDMGRAIADIDANLPTARNQAQRNFLQNMQDQKYMLNNSFYPTVQEFTSRGTIAGNPASKEQIDRLLALGGRIVNTYAEGARYMEQFATTSIAKKALADSAKRALTLGNKLAEGVGALIEGGAEVIKKTGQALGWLPWVLGAIVVGPLLLKTFSGYKTGGSRGAADAASGELERARGALTSGGKALARRAGLSGTRRRRSR
jgi:hypothetical protein